MGRALVCVVLLAAVGGGEAMAQVNNDAAAEVLFVEGRSLMKKKDFARAADKFAASDKASPSVGARLSLGDCYAQLGKTASAWSAYKSAENLARQKQDGRRAKIAATKARSILAKLSYLIVAVPDPVAGLEVTVAGNPLSSALFGQRVPLDPGTVVVAARAPGYKPFESKVAVAKTGAVTVKVPRLVSATEPDVEPDNKPDVKPDNKPDVEPDNNPDNHPDITPDPGGSGPVDTGPGDPGRGRRILGLGVGAVGVVAAGVGLVFGAQAKSAWNDAFDSGECQEATNICSAAGQEQTDDARSKATIATVGVVGGAVLIGAGVVIYLTAPKADSGDTSARLAPAVGPDQIGFALSGSF